MSAVLRQAVVPESAEDLLLLRSSAVMIWASRADGACTFFSEGWLRFRGRHLEEELGDGWAEGVYPNDLARCLAVYRRALERHAPFRMAYRLRGADGSWRWIADQGSPRFTPAGAFAGMLGACVDLTPEIRPREPFSPAELRVLALLPTHLSAAEITRRWSPLASLSDREREVLVEVATGKSNAAIAESLVVTKRAVEKHIHAIFSKLGLPDDAAVSRRVVATLMLLADEPADQP